MQTQLKEQALWYQRQERLGRVTHPPMGMMLMGQTGLSVTVPLFMPRGQEAVDVQATILNLMPQASGRMQPMGSDFRSMAWPADTSQCVPIFSE